MNEKKDLRLHVYISRCGIASRRACEKIIESGRIAVNGAIVTQMGVKVKPDDIVTIDDKRLYLVKVKVYIALNKPVGYICSNFDSQGRRLAIDLLKDATDLRLFHVGRLDLLSSGLIFYTNDGEFTKIVSHPSSTIKKEYIVETLNDIDEYLLKQYLKGIIVDGEKYKLESYRLFNKSKAILVLYEGKNREIRRILESRGNKCKKIHRIKIGIITTQGLLPGQFRFLKQNEVKWFLNKRKK